MPAWGFCLTQVTVLDALDAAREAFSSAVLVPPVCYTVPPDGGAPLGAAFGSCDKLSWSSCV